MAHALSSHQRQYLKKLAHGLDPLVQVGNGGLSEGVQAALNQALTDHELVKVRLGKGTEGDKKAVAEELANMVGAQLCQVIGRVVVLYRQATDPKRRKIRLSEARKPTAASR